MNDSLPIVVGVSGHRLIRESDEINIRMQINDQLQRIRDKCPSSKMELLSSLAIGADSFCAEEALELGYDLIAVLPFEQEEYEQDFSEEELIQFHLLLAKAKEVITLNSIDQLKNRDQGYLEAGLYVAEHCPVFMAVWDGAPGKKGGCGTAEVVDYIRGGLNPSFITPTPCVSIIHISAIRPNGEGESGIVELYERKDGATDSLLKTTDDFNSDVEKLYEKGYPLLNEEQLADAPDNIKLFHRIYMQADALSVYFRDRYLSTMRYTSVLGVLIVLSLLFYNQIGNSRFLILWFRHDHALTYYRRRSLA